MITDIHVLLDHFNVTGIWGFVFISVVIGSIVFIFMAMYKSVPEGFLGGKWSNTKSCSVKKGAKINEFMIDKTTIEIELADALHSIRSTILCDRVVLWMFTNGVYSFDKQMCFDFVTPSYESSDSSYPAILNTNKVKMSSMPNVAKQVFISQDLIVYKNIDEIEIPDIKQFERLGTKSVILAPIKSRGVTVGVLTCSWVGSNQQSFSDSTIGYVKQAQIIIGTHVSNLRLLCKKKG